MIPHFGLTKYLPYFIYFGSIGIMLVSLKRPILGFYTLVLILPFEIIKERLPNYFQANNLFDYYFLAIIIGIFLSVKRQSVKDDLPFEHIKRIAVYLIIFTFLGLIIGAIHFGLGNPFNFQNTNFLDWKNYIMMPILYFMATKLLLNEKVAKNTALIMTISLGLASWYYFINYSDRNLSVFRWSIKNGVIFPTLGGNEFAAFCVHFFFLPLCLYFFEKDKKFKIFYLAIAVITIYPILFLFSRGAYLAGFIAFIFISLKLKKALFIIFAAILLIFWHTLLPPGVVERIQMTESEGHLDDSAASRFELWEKGIKMFIKSPLFGAGFGTYRYFGGRNDPHNYYIEMLSTQGIIGFSFIVLLFYYTFKNGGILYKEKGTEFLTGLGLSVQGITVAIIITNLFGDRWSYFHLGGYYWILMATVTNARSFAKRNTKNLTDEIRQKKTLQNKI